MPLVLSLTQFNLSFIALKFTSKNGASKYSCIVGANRWLVRWEIVQSNGLWLCYDSAACSMQAVKRVVLEEMKWLK